MRMCDARRVASFCACSVKASGRVLKRMKSTVDYSTVLYA